MIAKKIKVLCVDDSALMRDLLTEIINAQPDMHVVATASDPLIARDLIKRHDPDVLTLDINMPRMDGLVFLTHLMRLRPMPVLMVSSLTRKNSKTSLKALELGAVDVIAKSGLGIRDNRMHDDSLIVDKIRAAAQSKPCRLGAAPRHALAALTSSSYPQASKRFVMIGASTGGTEAIRHVLEPLPENAPGIVIAQHMPSGFTRSFAERLDRSCRIKVSEATHGEPILPGHAYVAPGGIHLKVAREGTRYVLKLDDGEPVNRHRPSVDVLFESAAQHLGKLAIGILLTGMGKDGAAGLGRMRQAGAMTLAQNEATCVVYGMPREAVAQGAAREVLALSEIPRRLMESAASAAEH
ncbi:chemotaxis response regulator protein-glutamate methylesterase [Pistricoccus aurantiacus]|uniref:Protein-glutamate methylesterase/protein-glutamine glutaminase n=1 Tax=Pistricoccus aurantiacus TaxID=1883414 RepID=A0A5B8SV41_9GAMM|nr:chemotaxis response regulator protein-glutamate methylesterase [Pistricoccus aurantiacus]QEA40261.1 chemotaxis response regulator protein-glutamate methylesterase [Pistricoccus aurantiacus]